MNRKKSGFTLLEIIIVIIIVGVLASLAMPRFFRTVQYSSAMEALTALGTLRQSMYRCYMMAGGSYANCGINDPALADPNTLDVDDPADDLNAQFTYVSDIGSGVGGGNNEWIITATHADGTISIDSEGDKSGTGIFASIQ